MSIASVMPSSHLILWRPLLLLPSIFPSIRDFSNESAVRIRWPKYWSFGFSVSPLGWFSLRLTGLSPCYPRDSQESSPAPQFKGINSLVFCLLYGPTLSTVPDHWEDHNHPFFHRRTELVHLPFHRNVPKRSTVIRYLSGKQVPQMSVMSKTSGEVEPRITCQRRCHSLLSPRKHTSQHIPCSLHD